MSDYERKFIDLPNGERFAYIDEGQGDKIILGCHGNYSSCLGLTYLVDNYKDRYRVIVPDNRGFGESSYNTPITSMEEYAADIVLFAKTMGIEKCYVYGHSFGGGTAMEVAIQAPEMVEKLVLVAPTSVGGYPLLKQDEEGQFHPYESIEEMANSAANKPVFDMIAGGNIELIMQFLANISPSRADQPELLRAFAIEAAKERCLVDVCWAMATWNITAFPGSYGQGNGNIAKIVCPVFLATAGKDSMVFPFMNELNKNCLSALGKLTYVHYENSSHAIYEDEKDLFPTIDKFLAE